MEAIHSNQLAVASFVVNFASTLINAQRYFNISSILDKKTYTDFHRPQYKGRLSFNISHSGNVVVCAMSQTYQVGVDVELVQELDLIYFQQYLSEDEWQKINASKAPYLAFLKYWTQKEAALKADGRGLGLDINHLNVVDSKISISNTVWHLNHIPLDPRYICHVATDKYLESNDLIVNNESFFF